MGPKVRRYIGEIDDHIRKAGFHGSFLIVQSTGGLYESEQAQTECVRMLESGPAAGVIGTQSLCRTLGIKNAIAFDRIHHCHQHDVGAHRRQDSIDYD
jgi:N-methylhydantoinase A